MCARLRHIRSGDCRPVLEITVNGGSITVCFPNTDSISRGSTMYEPDFDEVRFRDLMLYLAHRCQDADYFGSTKLCKLLYYSDFTAFARTGSPITGADYVRQPLGSDAARVLSPPRWVDRGGAGARGDACGV